MPTTSMPVGVRIDRISAVSTGARPFTITSTADAVVPSPLFRGLSHELRGNRGSALARAPEEPTFPELAHESDGLAGR